MKNEKEKFFIKLCNEVQGCDLCPRMKNSARVLNGSAGSIEAPILFLGEAPGRLGADGSGIPFHGDTAGANFERLLAQVGISRYQIFVTNSVLCNPKDEKGNNSTPNIDEIRNCSTYLKRQIELVNPKIIVTLGATALKALSFIENHKINLKKDVRRAFPWFKRILISLYHPGQRAMIHRSFSNQLADYQYVAEQFKRLGQFSRPVSNRMKEDILPIIDFLTSLKPDISYFALHKLFYLIEYEHAKKTGTKLTSSFFIRQKDGPYCTDLHFKKLEKFFPNLLVTKKNHGLYIERKSATLFDMDFNEKFRVLNGETREIIMSVVEKYGNKSNAELKEKVYLTVPMRNILKAEKDKFNFFNSPIEFVEF